MLFSPQLRAAQLILQSVAETELETIFHAILDFTLSTASEKTSGAFKWTKLCVVFLTLVVRILRKGCLSSTSGLLSEWYFVQAEEV